MLFNGNLLENRENNLLFQKHIDVCMRSVMIDLNVVLAHVSPHGNVQQHLS